MLSNILLNISKSSLSESGVSVMALINCPECNAEISNQAEKCIHCGYKIKTTNKIRKKWMLLIIIVLVLLLGISLILIPYMTNRSAIQEINSQIESIDSISIDTASEILDVYSEYKQLSSQAQFFISEKDKLINAVDELKQLKIEITEDNILDYIQVEIQYSDMRIEDKLGGFWKEYYTYCDMEVNISSISDFEYEDVVFNLYNTSASMSWSNSYFENIKLDEDGNYTGTNEMTYAYTVQPASTKPSYNSELLVIENVSGSISLKDVN